MYKPKKIMSRRKIQLKYIVQQSFCVYNNYNKNQKNIYKQKFII